MERKILLNTYGIPVVMLALAIAVPGCHPFTRAQDELRLWYDEPAVSWNEALPVGNGRLGAMVFGGTGQERIQFNEETLWDGRPRDYSHKGASEYLDEIRQLVFEGKQEQAHALAMEKFMSIPLRQMNYQPFGDLYLSFPGHGKHTDYFRGLDLRRAVCLTSYTSDGIRYQREVIASSPRQVIAMHLASDREGSLDFSFHFDTPYRQKEFFLKDGRPCMNIAVDDGVLKGSATVVLETDGRINAGQEGVSVSGATTATLYLNAATSFVNYRDVSHDPQRELEKSLAGLEGNTWEQLKQEHIRDYQSLFKRFSIDLGSNLRDSLPTGRRLHAYQVSPGDPALMALYVQYARYLMISASREGTFPANLQGIWNQELEPPWGSKYTVNINTEMNYWPAEVMNLSDCHEPLFRLIGECVETGRLTARNHYDCDGWVLHHNTDLWRGTAPINHANHGIWVCGSGWLSRHLWEHYLYTQDEVFLRQKAYPVMREAALFYTQYLIPDPETGWLISTPSNSPENGGLVAGPTMDHQVIRSLFRACVEASGILGTDEAFSARLQEMIPRIAPNRIGRLGQLQEWMEDIDDPENKHRHVSHLWGVHPGNDINWKDSPELMEAARKSLIMRGDEGTGWSLAWKINFWARFLDGNRAANLVSMLFRPVPPEGESMGGGSFPNLFDTHPGGGGNLFQIDGNFGGAAGILEMLMQSHLGSIDLLPALPDELGQGSIAGICARGGYELDFAWKDGELQTLTILSKAGGPCKLRYRDNTVEFNTEKGQTYTFNGRLGKSKNFIP
jgi:alpha-L-fucosidase 2